MKLTSLITAALAAPYSAYALSAGPGAISDIAPRVLTVKYVTKYWNTTITNGIGSVGTGNARATENGGVGLVIPSGTGNMGPTSISGVLPVNGTGRHEYTGTVIVNPGLGVTTVLSFVTVVPTPAKNLTVVIDTAYDTPTGFAHAYYGDPLRHQHRFGVIRDNTVVDNTPTAILATEVIGTPSTVNKRNEPETVDDALNASLFAKEKRFFTRRAGFMAHKQVFVRPACPTRDAQRGLELRCHHADDGILTEDDLGNTAALDLRFGHTNNADLIYVDDTTEEPAGLFGNDGDLKRRQSLVQTSRCKHVDEKFRVTQCTAASVNLSKGAGKEIGAGAARNFGIPVRTLSQDDLTNKEIEVRAGAHDSNETRFNRPAEKFARQGTHGGSVLIRDGGVVNLEDIGIPAGTHPEIDAELPLPTLDEPQFHNFWSWKTIREWSEKHFAQRLGQRDQIENVEVVESTSQPIEVAKRKAFLRVTEADILKHLPKIKVVGEDMPRAPIVINDGGPSEKFIATPEVHITVTIYDCCTRTAANAKRQIATVRTEYGNQNPVMANFEELTTFRTVKVSLDGGVSGPPVVLSGSFPTPTASASSEYGNQNPGTVNLPELGIRRTFSRITNAAEATAYAKRQTEIENPNMGDLGEATLFAGRIRLDK